MLWREMLNSYTGEELADAGPLWAEAFDPAAPVATPAGLTEGSTVLEHLARAVQVLDRAGVAVDVPLGEVQYADRGGVVVPVHGGDFIDGTTNVASWGGRGSTFDPYLASLERELNARHG